MTILLCCNNIWQLLTYLQNFTSIHFYVLMIFLHPFLYLRTHCILFYYVLYIHIDLYSMHLGHLAGLVMSPWLY